ncbi:Ldh family oxidoreductase [Cupriavidus sp. IDO]|uniref:Ldh family oxidoreductase n=1 Tax=Cupriavidus sp. IDO TaxID=1539142 RepID=UPI0005792133|nr:Ldh family oxidoreductase [Cupriavidus sp. IDO]KWR83774.1 sulfolactate dehydrogenase [Cupriavidus sp. IDO]
MTTRYSPATLEQWIAAVFEASDVPAAHAAQAADVLVRSELRGYKTHGLTRVASYADRLAAGDFNPRPAMTHRVFPGGVVLNADGAMGQVAGPHAVRLGLQALETSASVLVAVQDCGHLGALGIHALLAAEAGAFCMAGQRTPPLLAMEGFSRAAIGHNPIAFGCPVPGGAPIVFDVACSVAARGHILLAAREGRPIPSGWALDADGVPTTDAGRALDGSLLPMGGHKGIGIAMMVECLAGAMAATAESLDPARDQIKSGGAAGKQGGFVWLVRPAAFSGDDLFAEYMKRWTDTYLDAGGDEARLPGQRGDVLERAGHEDGITLPGAIAGELRALGQRLGLPFPD